LKAANGQKETFLLAGGQPVIASNALSLIIQRSSY
jgi:hypothetical protein